MANFMDEIQSESKKYGGGGGNSDFFSFEEGVNRMRILVQPKVIAYHFPPQGKPDVCVGIDEGCTHHGADAKKPTIRLCTYIIDRKDNKVKFAELPLSISYSLNDLQEDEDFAFDDFPMPYDVKITHDPKNPDPKAKYRLVGSPKQEPLTDLEKTDLENAMLKMTPEQYVQTRKDKQANVPTTAEEAGGFDSDDIDPKDIPF